MALELAGGKELTAKEAQDLAWERQTVSVWDLEKVLSPLECAVAISTIVKPHVIAMLIVLDRFMRSCLRYLALLHLSGRWRRRPTRMATSLFGRKRHKSRWQGRSLTHVLVVSRRTWVCEDGQRQDVLISSISRSKLKLDV